MPIRTAKHEPNELRRWGSVAAASGAAVLAGMLAFNAQPSFADSEVRNLDFAEGQPIAYKACISIRFAPDDCSNVPGPATWAIDTT
jgi:hypothetical protein